MPKRPRSASSWSACSVGSGTAIALGPDPLELDTRRRLYAHLASAPGLHLRELQRRSGLAMGSLEYHLGRLEKAGLVSVLDDGHKRFFPCPMSPDDRRALAFLRQELPRRVLLLALERPGIAKGAIGVATGAARSTLDYHLQRLADASLVRIEHAKGRALVSAVDGARIERLLVAYRSSFLDRMVDAYLGGLEGFRREEPREE